MSRPSKQFLSPLFAFVFTIGTVGLCAQTSSPEEKLLHTFGAFRNFHAEFEHDTRSTELQTGEVWIGEKGTFRIETGAPLNQTVVSDGISVWTHDRDLDQVIIRFLGTRIDEMPVLLFSGDPKLIFRDYDVEFFQEEPKEYFLLRPNNQDSLFTSVLLAFIDGLPISLTVENAVNNRTTVRLKNVEKLHEVPEKFFTFRTPQYADIIDDRIR